MRSDDDAPDEQVSIYTDMTNARPQKLKYDADTATDDIEAFPSVGTSNRYLLADLPAADEGTNITYQHKAQVRGSITEGDNAAVSGTFTCTNSGGTCALTRGSTTSRLLSAAPSTGWSFTSTENHEGSAIQDDDFLYFGYWLHTPSGLAGDMDYEFTTIAGGSKLFNTSVNSLVGTATYEGPAVGKYIVKEGEYSGTKFEASSAQLGKFTADASLTANFTGNKIGTAFHNMIEGTITNFRDGANDLDFQITLGASINDAGLLTLPEVTSRYGTTLGTSGTWGGQFYGAIGTGDAATTTLPTGISGTFSAGFPNAYVAGGFGANRKSVTNQ